MQFSGPQQGQSRAHVVIQQFGDGIIAQMKVTNCVEP